jgi:hypothetical protein
MHSERGIKNDASGASGMHKLIRNEEKRNLLQAYSHYSSRQAYKVYRQAITGLLVMLLLLYMFQDVVHTASAFISVISDLT